MDVIDGGEAKTREHEKTRRRGARFSGRVSAERPPLCSASRGGGVVTLGEPEAQARMLHTGSPQYPS